MKPCDISNFANIWPIIDILVEMFSVYLAIIDIADIHVADIHVADIHVDDIHVDDIHVSKFWWNPSLSRLLLYVELTLDLVNFVL